MEPTTIKIAFGGQEVVYHLIETNAPRAFDYGGVIELYQGDGKRYILVQDESMAYQEGRNRSGMYTFAPSGDLTERAIADDLWRHLLDINGN